VPLWQALLSVVLLCPKALPAGPSERRTRGRTGGSLESVPQGVPESVPGASPGVPESGPGDGGPTGEAQALRQVINSAVTLLSHITAAQQRVTAQ